MQAARYDERAPAAVHVKKVRMEFRLIEPYALQEGSAVTIVLHIATASESTACMLIRSWHTQVPASTSFVCAQLTQHARLNGCGAKNVSFNQHTCFLAAPDPCSSCTGLTWSRQHTQGSINTLHSTQPLMLYRETPGCSASSPNATHFLGGQSATGQATSSQQLHFVADLAGAVPHLLAMTT